MAGAGLQTSDVRALLRLVGELRELSAPSAWRQHLSRSLAALCGARAVLVGELDMREVRDQGSRNGAAHDRWKLTVLHRHLHGIADPDVMRFERDVAWGVHGPNEVFAGQWSCCGQRLTIARRQLVKDNAWYGSQLANEHFRVLDCDDFIVHMLPIPCLHALTAIKMFRAWGDAPFRARDRLLIELLTDELAHDWSFASRTASAALSPRQQQVLALLLQGATDKDVAAALAISVHTAHDYVKALYRSCKVHSRTELMSRFASRQGQRAQLVVERLQHL